MSPRSSASPERDLQTGAEREAGPIAGWFQPGGAINHGRLVLGFGHQDYSSRIQEVAGREPTDLLDIRRCRDDELEVCVGLSCEPAQHRRKLTNSTVITGVRDLGGDVPLVDCYRELV